MLNYASIYFTLRNRFLLTCRYSSRRHICQEVPYYCARQRKNSDAGQWRPQNASLNLEKIHQEFLLVILNMDADL